MTDPPAERSPALVLPLDRLDGLTSDFLDACEKSLNRSIDVPVTWRDLAAEVLVGVAPDEFLAWAWSNRGTLVAEQLRRRDRYYRTQAIQAPGTVPESAALGALGRKNQRRYLRQEATKAACLEGILSGRWSVPARIGAPSVPIGLMTSEDLLSVADGLDQRVADMEARARFFRLLAKPMEENQTVLDHYGGPDRVEQMWRTFSRYNDV